MFLLLLLLPDWYIYKVYVRGAQRKWIKRLYWLPTVLLLLVLLVFLIINENFGHYFGVYLVVTLCIAVPKLVYVLSSLLLRGVGKLFRCAVPHGMISLIPALAVFCYIYYGGTKGKENFRVNEVTFVSPDLPDAFNGYRILQISDIHSGSWERNQEALQDAIRLCNEQHPDLAVFTGDLVNSRADEMKDLMPVFSQLKAKDGVYSILGNHDYATYTHWNSEVERLANVDTLISRENRMGWQMLLNENRIIRRGNDSIALVGVENSGNPPFPDLGDLPKALRGTDGMFKVLLSHDPTHWRREVLPQTDIQLMLAGHTHEMQVSVFGFSPSQFIYPEHCGMYLEGKRGLYVNIGLGYVLFPMRLGAWPEITVITLQKEK